jgi:uncharacterized protein (TIGR02996 family)
MSDLDVSRRSFLVMIGGAVLGTYALPACGASEAAEGTAVVTRTISKPLRKWLTDRVFASTREPAFFLLWMEEGADGEMHTMVWTPETPAEIAEARRFYEDARNFNPSGLAESLPPLDPREEALAEAVLDHLDDDGPRLAYAAFLSERGSSQGEFVQNWCQTETMAEDDPAKAILEQRWAELLNNDAEEWFQPLMSLGLRPGIFGRFYPALWLFPRGLIEEVEIDRPGILPEQAEQLIRAAPVLNRVRITYDDIDLPALASCPFLARVSDLEVSSLGLPFEALEPFLDSPYLLRLRRLDLGYNDLGQDLGPALSRASFLANLRTLDIPSVGLGSAGAVALFQGWTQGEARELDLGGNALDAAALAALVSCPAAGGLRVLKLTSNPLGAAGIAVLATAPFLGTLTELHLDVCALDVPAVAALARLSLPSLTYLKLGNNKLQEAGAKSLASARWPGLTRLELGRCELGDAGLVALAGSSLLPGLTELTLVANQLGSRGISALARVAWSRLRILNLRQNRCGEDGAKALASCAGLAHLEELDLEDNTVGAVGAGALAASPHLGNLRKLAVTAKFLGPTGQAALLKRFGEDVVQVEE